MDDKKKWWERSAWVRTTKDKGSTSDAGDDGRLDTPGHFEGGGAAADPLAVAPGAFAVHGPGYHGEDDDDDAGSAARIDREERRGGGNDEASEAPPFHVDSYAVNQGPTDEEIRQRILAGTAHAEAVTGLDEAKTRRSRTTVLLLAVAAVVVVAVVVGVSVPLATSSQTTSPNAEGHDEDVVASVAYLEYQGSGGFAMAIRAQTRWTNGALVTSGSVEVMGCRPKVCLESDDTCVVGKFYSPGCCTGADCANETKCGEMCPRPPESCYLTDPSNTTCLRSECYTCNQYEGEEIYNIFDYAWEIACLEVGTAIRPENGQTNKWAIYCGPVVLGAVVEENRDLGEYQCAALRVGANYSDDDGGVSSGGAPCQIWALDECGCGPPDIYTFGLPEPTGPCLPETCHFLCEDAPRDYNLCKSFPGNISWWVFDTDVLAAEYELDIYIKGLDT